MCALVYKRLDFLYKSGKIRLELQNSDIGGRKMRSLSHDTHTIIAATKSFLKKKEVGPNRDPLVVLCHKPFAVFWTGIGIYYALTAGWTFGAVIYFVLFFCLYHSSGRYHYFTPNRKLWFTDQVAIGWFILATHLPFVDQWWVWTADTILAAFTVFVKHHEAKARPWKNVRKQWCTMTRFGSFYLLGLGVWSSIVMVCVGIPNMGWGWWSWEAKTIYLIIGLFLLEWLVYHYDVEHPAISDWFGKTELKHFIGANAKSLLNRMIIAVMIL